jgi:hypothetical protein
MESLSHTVLKLLLFICWGHPNRRGHTDRRSSSCISTHLCILQGGAQVRYVLRAVTPHSDVGYVQTGIC